MTEFNSNLNNLFKNYQQKQMYQKYQDASAKDKKNKDLWKDIDVNGDGKITSKDFSKLNSTEKSLLKKTKLFDVNGDGKFNQTDIDMFVKGDVDGDGKITEEELNFVSEYKDDLLSVFTNKKASFVLDGKKYVKGEPANGIISGKYYKDGALATGTVDGKYYYKGKLANSTIGGKMYQNGVLANDTVNGKLYKNGVLFSGTASGKLYKNGVLFSGTQNDKMYQAGVLANGTVSGKMYQNGVLANGTVNGKLYKDGNEITIVSFNNGKTLELKNGETYKKNSDGSIDVTSADGKTVTKYDKNGVLKRTIETKISNDKTKIVTEIAYNNGKPWTKTVTSTLNNKTVGYSHTVFDTQGNISYERIKSDYENGKAGLDVLKAYAKNGSVNYEVEDSLLGDGYPKVTSWGNTSASISFDSKGSKKVTIKTGDIAEINKDGNLTITKQDGSVYTYYTNGVLRSVQETNIDEDGTKTITDTTYRNDGTLSVREEITIENNQIIADKYTSYDTDGNIETERIKNNYDANGNSSYDELKSYAKDGSVNYEIKDYLSGDGYPTVNKWGNKRAVIYFDSKGSKLAAVNAGETAKINTDGSVVITQKDGSIKKYDSTGNEINLPVLNKTYENGKISSISKVINGETVELSREEFMSYLNDTTITRINANSADVSDRLLEDILLVKYAETKAERVGQKGSSAYQNEYNSIIKSEMVKTPFTMTGTVGEIVEQNGILYVNDGTELQKLDISADTYLKLFPPIERYDINQPGGSIGDCYFISGCLIDMMKNKTAFAKLIKMFSENDNGDISIKFKGTLSEFSPVTFKNGLLKTMDGLADGLPVESLGGKTIVYKSLEGSIGIKMLEQAYAISRFAQDSSDEVTEINIDKIDVDAAIPSIAYGGWQNNVYKEVLGIENKIVYSRNYDFLYEMSDDEFIKIKNEWDEYNELIKDYPKELPVSCQDKKFASISSGALKNTIRFQEEFEIDNIWAYSKDENGEPDVEKFKEIAQKSEKVPYSKMFFDATDDYLYDLINYMDEFYQKYTRINEIVNSFKTLIGIDIATNNIGVMRENRESVIESRFEYFDFGDYLDCQNLDKAKEKYLSDSFDGYADDLKNGKVLLSCGFIGDRSISSAIHKGHAYSIEKIDLEEGKIYFVDPGYGGGIIEYPLDKFKNVMCAKDRSTYLHIGYLN